MFIIFQCLFVQYIASQYYTVLSLSFKRFPFDPYNPIGYMIAIILEYIMLGFNLFLISCTLSLGIGFYCFSISLTKEIQCMLHTINDKAQAKKNQSNDLRALFSDYIDNHSIVKQLSCISFNVLNMNARSTFPFPGWYVISRIYFNLQLCHYSHGVC